MINYLSRAIKNLKNPLFPYWTACIYSFRKWISRYGYYPSFLPLCIYTDHGAGDSVDSPYPHELQSDAPVQFYHCKAAVERWKKQSDKECHVLPSPFVFARQQLKINPNSDRVGSIYYLAHGNSALVDQNECDIYLDDINKLPDKYKPVKICLHVNEMELGYDDVYRTLGYEVVTAGDPIAHNFTENFYRILATAKYTFSSTFGSYALYSVEMGIPFCLYGTPPDYYNISDSNIELGKYSSYMNSDYYKQAVKLFGKLPDDQVTPEQTAFVSYHLGLDDGISRLHMSWILYKSFAVWLFKKACNKVSNIAI